MMTSGKIKRTIKPFITKEEESHSVVVVVFPPLFRFIDNNKATAAQSKAVRQEKRKDERL